MHGTLDKSTDSEAQAAESKFLSQSEFMIDAEEEGCLSLELTIGEWWGKS